MSQNELYHYGVLGMKWGRRKKYYNQDGSLNKVGKARKEYKDSKKKIKQIQKQKTGFAYGIKGIERVKAKNKRLNEAYVDSVSKKAKFNAAKATNSFKAARSVYKTYKRELNKVGLPGSYIDNNSYGRATALYNRIIKEKGKQYADKMVNKVSNELVGTIIGGTAAAIGTTIVSNYIANKY